MKTCTAFLLSLPMIGSLADAGPRSSASYSIVTDAADSGGTRTTSAAYINDGGAGMVGGLATVALPIEAARSGYLGQLYDIVGLTLNSVSVNSSINETATLQLAAWQLLDDTSFLAVDANSVNWSVVSGPITDVSSAGLATAGAVYQNTAATVQGLFSGLAGTLNLTVIDSIPDNFGSYAGDGIDDAWQVQYFGQPPNAQAGPNVDADGTGQTNLFKFIAGLDPTDHSRFTITIAPVPGQPGQQNVIFNPVVAGRTYTVTAKTSLNPSGGWNPNHHLRLGRQRHAPHNHHPERRRSAEVLTRCRSANLRELKGENCERIALGSETSRERGDSLIL